MSFFTSHSSYADHPFSYSVHNRSPTFTLGRMGTTLWDTLVRRDSGAAALHDMALTAQPPVLKRNVTRHSNTAVDTVVLVEEVLVGLALTVAVGWLARYVAVAVQGLLMPSKDGKKSSP